MQFPRNVLLPFLLFSTLLSAQTPEPVWGIHIGTPGADNVEDAVFGPDGFIYVVGNLASPLTELPGGLPTRTVGNPEAEPKYGCAFVMKLDPATGRPLAFVQFAPGLLHLTSVITGPDTVYLGGYGTQGMELLAKSRQGFMQTSGLSSSRLSGPTPFIHRDDPHIDKARDGRGRPMVLRVTPDLQTFDAATFLEGWHHIWHVPPPLNEDRHSPVAIGLLANGDVVAAHDGGQRTPHPVTGKADSFYQARDHLSCLSPDLKQRRWHTPIETPPVDTSRAQKLLGEHFTHDWMGNVRTFRLRIDPANRIYVCGWAASKTMKEPWWAPFLIQYDPATGKPAWRGWTVDPTGGGDGRMKGLVSDSVVRSIAFDEQGRLLAAMNSDGGNNIAARPPNDYTQEGSPKLTGDTPWGMRGRTLFIGNVQRLDETRENRLGGSNLLGRQNRTATAAWPIDLCSLPEDRVFVVGRYTRGFGFKQAWSPSNRPGSFLRVYSPDFQVQFSTGLDGTDLRNVQRRGNLLVVSGTSSGPAPVGQSPFQTYQGGKTDGYVLLLRVPQP
jgi:hypothetical protein